jgi:hypothetical protein
MVRKGKGSGSIGIKADSRFMVRTTRFFDGNAFIAFMAFWLLSAILRVSFYRLEGSTDLRETVLLRWRCRVVRAARTGECTDEGSG